MERRSAGVPLVVTMPQTSTTYTATFGKQYSLTTASNPAVGGSVSPAGVSWWNAGATTTGVTATANPGYQFTGWSGASDIDGQSCAGDRDGRTEGVDGEIWEAGGVYGDERAFGPSGVGGREYVHDAAGVQLASWDGPYDRGDVSSAGCVGDAVCVSGVERSGGPEPYGDGAPDGFDVYGDVRDSACGDGFGESIRGGDVDVESRGDRGGGRPELVCVESGGDGDDGSGECGLCLCELDGGSCDGGQPGRAPGARSGRW